MRLRWWTKKELKSGSKTNFGRLPEGGGTNTELYESPFIIVLMPLFSYGCLRGNCIRIICAAEILLSQGYLDSR